MARISFGATIGAYLGQGQYTITAARCRTFSTVIASQTAHFITLGGLLTTAQTDAATADTAVASSQALQAAVTAAVSAAAANGTITGDPTALGLVQAIQTAFNLLITAEGTAKTATAAAVVSANAVDLTPVISDLADATGVLPNVALDIDTDVATDQNAVRAAVRSIMERVQGASNLQ